MKQYAAPGLALILLAFCTPGAFALEWSEILSNPQGTDYGKEYAELIGTENLTGCAIRDRQSADQLVLFRAGSEVILILESDSVWLNSTADATIYTAGSAIGNGLDNTHEELAISCGNNTLASTRYNASAIPGLKDGQSIIWDAGSWVPGQLNGTPGMRNSPANGTDTGQDPQLSNTSAEWIAPDTLSAGGGRFCNSTLVITVNNTTVRAGEQLSFTIISDVYASFEVLAGNQTIMRGDTLTRREYGVRVPRVERLRIAALAENCGARLRASRTIIVQLPASNENDESDHDQGDDDESGNDTYAPSAERSGNESTIIAALQAGEAKAIAPIAQTSSHAKEVLTPSPALAAPPVTSAVVMDADRSMVPWVSAFGIVTLLVSAVIFFRLKEETHKKK